MFFSSSRIFLFLLLCLGLSSCSFSEGKEGLACLHAQNARELKNSCEHYFKTHTLTQKELPLLIHYAKVSNWNQAYASYQKIIQIEPENAWAWEKLGFSSLKLGDYLQSIEALSTAIAILPTATRYRLRAKARSALGDWLGAQDDLATSLRFQESQ